MRPCTLHPAHARPVPRRCIKNLAVRSVHSADVYYNHVKSARAVSEYAADPLPGELLITLAATPVGSPLNGMSAKTASLRACCPAGSGTCPPTAVFTCGDYLPILQDERCRRRPTCPCGPGGGISQCYSLEPGLLDIPGGASTTVIQVPRSPSHARSAVGPLTAAAHRRRTLGGVWLVASMRRIAAPHLASACLWPQVVRHPVDVILSAYFYHTQQPPPEEWIERVRMTGYGAEWVSGWVGGSLAER